VYVYVDYECMMMLIYEIRCCSREERRRGRETDRKRECQTTQAKALRFGAWKERE
jgi:hypothetical protein